MRPARRIFSSSAWPCCRDCGSPRRAGCRAPSPAPRLASATLRCGWCGVRCGSAQRLRPAFRPAVERPEQAEQLAAAIAQAITAVRDGLDDAAVDQLAKTLVQHRRRHAVADTLQ